MNRETMFLWLASVLISLVASSMPFAPKYNGVRLFLPVFPFLACLIGLGFGWVVEGLQKALGTLGPGAVRLHSWLAIVVGLAVLLPGVVGLANTHPYQLAYYNALVGGPLGAKEKGFETIYWGGVYLAALDYLNSSRPPMTEKHLIYVTPGGCISLLELYRNAGMLPLPTDYRFISDPGRLRDADIVIFQCAQAEFDRVSTPLYQRGRPIWGVYLQPGVPLLLVFDRQQVARVMGGRE